MSRIETRLPLSRNHRPPPSQAKDPHLCCYRWVNWGLERESQLGCWPLSIPRLGGWHCSELSPSPWRLWTWHVAFTLLTFSLACVLCLSVVSDSLRPYGPVTHKASLSMEFSRQEYWSGLPCPPPGDLPNSGIEPIFLTPPALTGRFFTTSTTWVTPDPL